MSKTSHAPAAEPTPDRPAKGRFALGNKGGPGNPFARQVAEIRKLLLNTVPGERLAKILLAMVERAEAGDVAAAKLVFQYTVGKPAEAVEPDRVEIEEHQLRRESTIPFDEWSPKVGDLSAAAVNSVWDTMGPGNDENTLMPILVGALEAEAAPPEKREQVERKGTRRAIRMLQEGIPPSPNGSIGRKIDKLRRSLHEEPKRPAKSAKTARAG
jgi:hypothetical protein